MTYGKRLDAALTYAKVDRRSLANALKCSPQAIGIVITGKGCLSVPNHAKAVQRLGVDSYWLATGEGEMIYESNRPLAPVEPAQAAIKGVATLAQITEALAGYLMHMDDDGRDDAADILRKLANKPENHARAATMLTAAFHAPKRKSA